MPNSSPQPDPYDAPKPTVAGSPQAEDSLAKTSGGSREEPTLNEVWDLMRAALKELIPHTPFYTWFQQATLRERQGTHLVLAVQNDFTCNWLLDHYAADIQRAAKRVVGPDAKVDIIVDAELAVKRTPRQRAPQPASQLVTHAMERPGLLTSSDVVLNPDYTFDKYVVGPCNRFAHAAAMGVSEAPGRNYNPFFIHGNVGLGKTHLLQSMCRAILDNNPKASILFLSCETFVNHFIGALENGDIQKFRQKYRDVDVLVVDDIHILANKERTQEECFHTFNALYNAGKQIVLSSDSPPKDIPSLQERLVSRFKWGLVTEIEPPCYETRMAILTRKCRERGGDLPDEVAKTLAERLDSNIRELEGAVNKLLGFSKLTGQPITTEMARHCLQDLFAIRRGPASLDDVASVVTTHFDVRLSELQSKRRTSAVAWPRQLAMFVSRRITGRSLKDIGGFYGGRDHSTVLHAIGKVEALVQTDPVIQDLVADLEARLKRAF